MSDVNVQELHANRGWDRRDLDAGKLAALAFSIKTSGWEEGHPVVYETLPDGRKEIRWGHRRTLAAVVAKLSNGAGSVEEMQDFILKLATAPKVTMVCPVCGNQVNDEQDRCFHCNADLFDDNDNGEPHWLAVKGTVQVPDMSTLITGYNAIIHSVDDLEVPAQEAAYVSDLDSQLSLIQDGLGREDADLVGLSRALLRAASLGAKPAQIAQLGLSSNEVASYLAMAQLPTEIALAVQSGDLALSVPRTIFSVDDPDKRLALTELVLNYGRVAAARVEEWVKTLRDFEFPTVDMTSSPRHQNAERVHATVYEILLDDSPADFWKMVITRATLTPPDDLVDHLPEIGCDQCPLKGKVTNLPKINAPQGGYACQTEKEPRWCLYNAPQVYADARVAAQADVTYPDGKYFSAFDLALAAYTALGLESEAPKTDGTKRPIDLQRERQGKWITEHTTASGYEHPLATRCDQCGYRTESSPVKSDDSVPHCAWCGKQNSIEQGYLVDEKGYTIPRCLGYSPVVDFVSLVPAADAGSTPKEVLLRVVEQLAGKLEQQGVPPLRRLTGVPFSAQERHVDWFATKLKEHAGTLTAGQLATLAAWLSAEIDLTAYGKQAVIQLKAGRTGQFSFSK